MSAIVERKHERVAAVLEAEIRSGRVALGSQLPGETVLARRFSVSRNTVRSALAELSDAGLISTRTGKGSFVSYQGDVLDVRNGWDRLPDVRGVAVELRLLGITCRPEPELADRLSVAYEQFIVVTRLRQLSDGTAVSLERSYLPFVPELALVPVEGLVEGSLTLTLARAGLYEVDGTQRVRVRAIDADEARILNRERGESFLDVHRTGWTASHQLVEHVEGMLDPRHFEVQVAWHR